MASIAQSFLRETENLEELKKAFRGVMRESFLSRQFVDQFKEISYGTPNDKLIIYYIFDKLNNVNAEGKELEPTNSASATQLLSLKYYKKMGHNIEHFLAKKDPVAEKLKDKDNIDSIGNLLFIHRKHNSTLGNKSPKQKMTLLKKWIKEGNINNKPYLDQFVNEYSDICEKDKWGEEVIEERTEKMARKIFDITSYFKNP